MPDRFDRERQVAIHAVRVAGILCRLVQEAIAEMPGGVVSKSDQSPVTVADFGSQALICRVLGDTCPEDPVIAEEGSAELRRSDSAELLDKVVSHVGSVLSLEGDVAVDREAVCSWIDRGGTRIYQERFWTLDPIDGTKGFLRNEQYAVALALIERGEPVVAALSCPNLPTRLQDDHSTEQDTPTGATFFAVRGQGAWMIPEGSTDAVRVSAGHASDSATARFCESVESGHSAQGDSARVAELLGIVSPPVRLDSQAKYAVVARGEADIYLRMPTKRDYREAIWDHAAGALIVTEAGGIVSDIEGRPLDFTRGPRLTENRGIVVASRDWHPRVFEQIKQLGLSSSE